MSTGLDRIKRPSSVFMVIKVDVKDKLDKTEADAFNGRLQEVLAWLGSETRGRASADLLASNARAVTVRFDRGGKRAAGGPGPG